MTNEELDIARVDEAIRAGNGIVGTVALIAARLAREGWTPPEPVDPDLAEAQKLHEGWEDGAIDEVIDVALAAIKRGRVLAAAEAKPGMVWKEHDGSDVCPVDPNSDIWIKHSGRTVLCAADLYLWKNVTHYCEIPQPEDAA